MNCDRSIRPKAVLLALVALILAGCAPNEPYRTKGAKTCPLDCGDATIEHHAQEGETYDLAFVEFTERGNVFNRDQMEEVLTYVSGLAHPQREGGDDGVLLVVFVHGWKHSAKPGDPNVDDFRDLLRTAARLSVNGGRRVVGVYVGWRGASVPVWGIEQITYWERKNVAEQVGKGGVTELLTRLEHIVLDTDQPNRNLFLVIGHSFGGAIVLSALNEVLLERVVAAEPVVVEGNGKPCIKSRPFGHGVVLLNPAMEANEAFQLKEVVARNCFPADQTRLMHVITSDADSATGWVFPIGQWFGMLRWREADLKRPDEFAVHESAIDTTAIGHYLPFQTGQLCSRESTRPECEREARPAYCYRASPDGERIYISYAEGDGKECVDADNPNHIPVAHNEPLAFIQTDAGFIGDHNDVFTNQVAAYLAAILVESRNKRGESGEAMRGNVPDVCADDPQDFGKCLHAYEERFAQIKLEQPEE